MSIKELFQNHLGAEFDGHVPYPTADLQIQKNKILTDFGEVESSLYFIKSGIIELCVKSYQVLKTVDFFFQGEFVGAYTSFLSQTPSDVQVIALTDCELEVVRYADLQKSYAHSFIANKMGRILNEAAYLRRVKREKNFLTKTAEELYLEMLDSHPQYISQIPVNKIARYLGIHPESLSRIRKKINS